MDVALSKVDVALSKGYVVNRVLLMDFYIEINPSFEPRRQIPVLRLLGTLAQDSIYLRGRESIYLWSVTNGKANLVRLLIQLESDA